MNLIDGKSLAATIREDVAAEIKTKNLHPKLAVLLVGEDPASALYVKLKERAALEVGITTYVRHCSAKTSDADLLEIIHAWNEDPTMDAMLVQLPLPDGHDTDAVIRAIDPRKDVDGFHPENHAALLAGAATLFPPVHESILRLIASTNTDLRGAHAAIVANSETFAQPLEHLLSRAGCFVTVTTPEDFNVRAVREASIIVVAVGRAGFITRDLITSGAVVIDVGTNKLPNGTTVGDVDAEHFQDIPGWLSPVPGGVGPMTVALLLKNTVMLATTRSNGALT